MFRAMAFVLAIQLPMVPVHSAAPAKRPEVITVKVSRIPSAAPIDMSNLPVSALQEIGNEVLRGIKADAQRLKLPPQEAAKLNAASSRGSFGKAGGTKLAIVRVRIGLRRPVAVIMGPSPAGLTEIYCSNSQGNELALVGNACAAAIRANFGGDVEE